jgi:photosystem II stability/assembly factor-like uncharacterized protein
MVPTYGGLWRTGSALANHRAMSERGLRLAAVVQSGEIYTSSDSGATWINQTAAGARLWQSVTSSSDGTKLAAVAHYGDIYISADSGATWTAKRPSSTTESWHAVASSGNGNTLLAVIGGTVGGDVWVSTNSGTSWATGAVGLSLVSGAAVSSDGTKLAAVVNGGDIFTSTDSGATWTDQTTAGSRSWTCITSSNDGTKLAAVDSSPGAHESPHFQIAP